MKKYLLSLLLFCPYITANSQCMNTQDILYISANGITQTATLVENEAVNSLKELLRKGPITISMTENGGFEKVGDLPQSFPTSDVRQTAKSGDIMLYTGSVLCIFYGSNTWAYTKIGTIDNMTSAEIKNFLAGNPAEVTLSIDNEESSADERKVSASDNSTVYDLDGNLIGRRPLNPGVYIIDGIKTVYKPKM